MLFDLYPYTSNYLLVTLWLTSATLTKPSDIYPRHRALNGYEHLSD